MTAQEKDAFNALRDALMIAHVAIEQRLPLTAVVAANGPTIGAVIAQAQRKAQLLVDV